MLALCLMLLDTYYAKNYASIIDSGLVSAIEIHIHVLSNNYLYVTLQFTPQIKGSCCGFDVMYHIATTVLQVCYNFPGVLQLSITMYIIMLELPMVCYAGLLHARGG